MKKFLVLGLTIISLLFISCNFNPPGSSVAADKTQDKSVYTIESTETISSVVKNVIHYQSIDTAGKPVTLSGYFEYCENTQINQIVLIEHGTIFFNNQAPSNVKAVDGEIKANKSLGRVVISPDYLGYGVSVSKEHPYMNQELTAINSIDCLLAVLQYFQDRNIKIADSHYTVVAGYSQGGASALATHKYMENNLSGKKKSLINLQKSFCGGTPADLIKTMDVFFEAPATEPIFVFYVLQSMLISYPEDFGNHSLQDFYKENIDIEKVKTGFNAKTQEGCVAAMTEFNGETKLINIHTDAITNKNSDLYKTLISCLKKNDLTDWEPKHQINFYHSTTDDTVPYANYESLMESSKMGRFPNLVKGFTGTGNHGEYASNDFFPELKKALDDQD